MTHYGASFRIPRLYTWYARPSFRVHIARTREWDTEIGVMKRHSVTTRPPG
ncbi:hypothetical protein ABIB99_004796 [Bradyrhizobium sp. LA6.1]